MKKKGKNKMFAGKTKSGAEVKGLMGVKRVVRKHPWILVTDRSRIRILEPKENLTGKTKLRTVVEIESKTGRLKARDIVSDRQGRSFESHTKKGQRGNSPRSAMDPRTTPADHELNILLRKGKTYLEKAHNAGDFTTLEIYGEPRLLGKIRRVFGNALFSVVNGVKIKDLAWVETKDLAERLGYSK